MQLPRCAPPQVARGLGLLEPAEPPAPRPPKAPGTGTGHNTRKPRHVPPGGLPPVRSTHKPSPPWTGELTVPDLAELLMSMPEGDLDGRCVRALCTFRFCTFGVAVLGRRAVLGSATLLAVLAPAPALLPQSSHSKTGGECGCVELQRALDTCIFANISACEAPEVRAVRGVCWVKLTMA
jgi:hypothetical protein